MSAQGNSDYPPLKLFQPSWQRRLTLYVVMPIGGGIAGATYGMFESHLSGTWRWAINVMVISVVVGVFVWFARALRRDQRDLREAYRTLEDFIEQLNDHRPSDR